MPQAKDTLWEKHKNDIKDIILIIGFLVSAGGWILSGVAKKNDLKTKVETLNTTVDNNTKQIEKLTDIIIKQSELNGKFIQHIETK